MSHCRETGVAKACSVRLSGIVRAKRERLSRLKIADTVQQWQLILPLVNAHLAADQRYLDGGAAEIINADNIISTPLPSVFVEAHQTRNHQRQSTPLPLSLDDEAARADAISRLRVHLSLLTSGSIRQSDEPLRLAIQVERLNEGIRQERSREEEIIDVLAALLALGPVSIAQWKKKPGNWIAYCATWGIFRPPDRPINATTTQREAIRLPFCMLPCEE